MSNNSVADARRALLAAEVKRQGLSVVSRLAKRPDRQINDMIAGRKAFGDKLAITLGPMIRPDLPRDWLVYPSALTSAAISSAKSELEAPTRSHIPVVGTAQLGDNGYWAELEYPVGHGDGYIAWPSRSGNAYALRCRGDSMKPRIKDGEYVIVTPDKPIVPGDEVLVKASDGRVMVKELLYIRDGMINLLSINEAHGKLQVAQSEIKAMHYVAGVVSGHLVDIEPPEPTKIEEPKPVVTLPHIEPALDEDGKPLPWASW